MPSGETFYDVLTRAVNDLAEHGYDSAERVAYWTAELKRAAARLTKSPAALDKMLRDALHAVYARLIDRGGIVKLNPGIARFTLERIRPALRAELDRRLLASASLIKLNRDEAIEKTLRRFQGWATSIPIGGSAEPDKREAKDAIRKSLAGLPFEERRVLIDQGHKLGNAINTTVCVGNGAIAATWHSNWRQPGYNYREDHKERSGQVYLVRDSWALKRGLIKLSGSDGYMDSVTQPAEEPFCRCRWNFMFHLRQLPDELLTAKGREALKAVRVA